MLLYQQEVFQRITPHHCLDYVRDSKNADNAPSVRACIQHFNRVSLIVIATVIGGTSPEGRAQKIVQWIDIASECRAIKNFSSLKAIISGLQSSAVYRLKRSWQSLPRYSKGCLLCLGAHAQARYTVVFVCVCVCVCVPL